MANEDNQDGSRAGFCAILGLPNVGKSTFLNQALGRRLVVVSNKPQTTRNRIVGVKNLDTDDAAVQIVFVDTPGVQSGKGALRKYMRDESLAAAGDCDVALLIIDVDHRAQRSPGGLEQTDAKSLLHSLKSASAPVILVLNKVDCIKAKPELLAVIEAFAATGDFAAIVPISALRGDGIDRVLHEVAQRMPAGPKLFPEEMYTDRAERFLAAELIREQLFRQLGAEVPYSTAVVVEQWTERREQNDVVISAVVYVERDSQKGIVVGKGGQKIRAVGEAARKAVSELLGCTAHVKLFVKVSANWSQRDQSIRNLGYEK